MIRDKIKEVKEVVIINPNIIGFLHCDDIYSKFKKYNTFKRCKNSEIVINKDESVSYIGNKRYIKEIYELPPKVDALIKILK